MSRGFLFIVLALLLVPAASAHEVRPAWLQISETQVAGTYDLVWKQPVLADRRLKIDPVLPASCETMNLGPGEMTGAALIVRSRIICGSEGLEGQTITIAGLERTMVDVFVEIVSSGGDTYTLILKPQRASFVMEAGAGAKSGTGFLSYFRLGVEHLLTGFDHILFVIGLVLLVRMPMKLVKVVTSFTVAHSLTLGLSTWGLVSLSQGAVEAVIALSILFLAVELVRAGRAEDSLLLRYPWAITFVFGLLHGFGFAAALTEIGLPQGTAALALLLFNLGVEAGQLIIVALVLAGLFVIQRLPVATSGGLRHAPAYLIGTLAAFWFLERTLSLFSG